MSVPTYLVSVRPTIMGLMCLLVSALLVRGGMAQCAGTTCSECVLSGDSCTWCSKANFTSLPRCQPRTILLRAGCEGRFIEEPFSTTSIQQNTNVTDADKADQSEAVQLQPQLITVTTRPKKNNRFPMTFRAANNFPVDLYFLFDSSQTMEVHFRNLASSINDIAQSISSISSNYLMGFGIFQDKVILPFTDTSPEKLKNPCVSHNSKCAPPFEFIHLLNMTNNVLEFKEKVSKTVFSSNLDSPEGSFEAIVQALACKSEIGWRSVSHKLLILASNSGFHLAGDGRLAGIVTPNDGHCHLDTKGRYTMGVHQDYPSLGQLADIVAKEGVHVVFAVTRNQVSLFSELANRIPTAIVKSLTNEEGPGNSNLKEIVETEYKNILSEVEIIHNKVSGVDIQIRATSEHCERKGTNKCKSVKSLSLSGILITFEVEVKVTECPSNLEESIKRVIIYPSTIKGDQLVLEIDTKCECPCKADVTTWEVNSETCTKGNGTLKCGLCDCQQGRAGQFCECGPKEVDTSGCAKAGENSTKLCNDAGKCECGLCKCDKGYSGPHCECYDRSCGHFRREVCGGFRGQCVCGECVCEPEYTGASCECPTSNISCIYEDTVCSNAGTCECGECKCKNGYTGVHCENCFLCDDKVCDILPYHDCAECASSEESDECPDSCPEMLLVNALENNDGPDICFITQADGCFLPFQVISSDNNITILVQETATCPQKINALLLAVGVAGGIVALSLLLLLLWKSLFYCSDKIKYSRFQEDMRKCQWTQRDNPFYKEAVTTYRNPLLDTNESTTDDR